MNFTRKLILVYAWYYIIIFNIINITKKDYEGNDEQFMKDMINLVNVVGFGLTLLYIAYTSVDKEWFYLTYFISLLFFVFMVINLGYFYINTFFLQGSI